MKPPILAALACPFLFAAAPSFANFIPTMPLETQHSLANLVVVGSLGERRACEVERQRVPCMEIHADVILKGAPAGPAVSRYLILSSLVSETDIQRMGLSGTLLMFLRGRFEPASSLGPEYFSPVQARRSLLRIDNSNNR